LTSDHLRILFFLNNVSKSRHFDGVIQALAERGHTVVLAAERQRNRPLWLPKHLSLVNRNLIARGLPGRIEVTSCPVHRVDRWRTAAPALRLARDYVRFCDPRYRHAGKLERRSASHAPPGWLRFIQDHPWVGRHGRTVGRLLAAVEDAIPSEKLFDLFIRYEHPDLILVTPLVDYGSYQTDYVKSGHRVGVPVVFAPFSWDNLTNRGLIRVEPDRVLVWNDIQKREATDLHGVSPQRVTVTGAPRFDDFFAMQPSTTREEFCHSVGLDARAPFVLYICSSEFVAPREVEFVQRWLAALRESPDATVRSASVLVRPHPAHVKQWTNVDLSAFGRVALWAEKETLNADQGLYDSLYHSGASVGLNTSAMIEAGILGKPVLTLVTEEFAGGQEETLHFHYLRASNGGLLTEARSFDEHVQQLGAALRPVASGESAVASGFSRKAQGTDQTRQFIERFVRPRGLQARVTPIMVEEIEQAARFPKRPHGPAFWHFPVRWSLRLMLALRSAPDPVTARRGGGRRESPAPPAGYSRT
jgi:hypothetical protein